MDVVPSAVTLSRSLMALSRSCSTGVLELTSDRQLARVALVDGTPRAVSLGHEGGESLGDALLRHGELDASVHAQAMRRGGPRGLLGDWLVESGAATRPAVEWALRLQLRDRILSVFRLPGLQYSFRPGSPDVGVPFVAEAVAAADLVLGAMRHAADVSQCAPPDAMRLELTSLGRNLLAASTLWPQEAAMLPLLNKGAGSERLLAVSGHHYRSRRFLQVLSWLGAVREPSSGSYSLLLRKRRQLRGRVGARALLDLPADADANQARRALRRLARELHPDRMGSHPGLAHASNEVMGALIRAEHELRRAG